MNFFGRRTTAATAAQQQPSSSSSGGSGAGAGAAAAAAAVGGGFTSYSRSRDPADLVRDFMNAGKRLEDAAYANAQRRQSQDVQGAGGAGKDQKDKGRAAEEAAARCLAAMKSILGGGGQGDGGGDHVSTPESITHLANELYASSSLALLLRLLPLLDFEAKRDAAATFCLLLRRQIGARSPTVDHVARYQGTIPGEESSGERMGVLVFQTLRGYEQEEDVALNTGVILKEMLRHESLARVLLYSDDFYLFPRYINSTEFGLSCDAFANMKECLTRHKAMVAGYLEANYDKFFDAYRELVLSPHYVTRRQSLKLLGEIILDRSNYTVMTRYIASTENLRLIMEALRDKSKNIQFEAFHVFKVFVANPHKPPAIASILRRNKDKLLRFLADFHRDREDEQFNDERAYLIQQIDAL